MQNNYFLFFFLGIFVLFFYIGCEGKSVYKSINALGCVVRGDKACPCKANQYYCTMDKKCYGSCIAAWDACKGERQSVTVKPTKSSGGSSSGGGGGGGSSYTTSYSSGCGSCDSDEGGVKFKASIPDLDCGGISVSCGGTSAGTINENGGVSDVLTGSAGSYSFSAQCKDGSLSWGGSVTIEAGKTLTVVID